jgi:hypothetical protein
MDIKPFQLEADAPVWKTENISPLLLCLGAEILTERSLGILNRARI